MMKWSPFLCSLEFLKFSGFSFHGLLSLFFVLLLDLLNISSWGLLGRIEMSKDLEIPSSALGMFNLSIKIQSLDRFRETSS